MDEVKHDSISDAYQYFLAKLAVAAREGPWMAAIWNVTDGRIRLACRTTSGFPVGDFPAAIGHLSLSLAEEMAKKSLPDDPLPSAFDWPTLEQEQGDDNAMGSADN